MSHALQIALAFDAGLIAGACIGVVVFRRIAYKMLTDQHERFVSSIRAMIEQERRTVREMLEREDL